MPFSIQHPGPVASIIDIHSNVLSNVQRPLQRLDPLLQRLDPPLQRAATNAAFNVLCKVLGITSSVQHPLQY